MQTWQQQPARQLADLLKWLLTAVSALHGRDAAHGALSLKAIACHPASGWRLQPPDTPPSDVAAARAADVTAVARILCFLSMSYEARRQFQPHHLPELSEEKLLELVADVPEVRLLAAALFRGGVSLEAGLSFPLWHPLAVHAPVPPHPSSPACPT